MFVVFVGCCLLFGFVESLVVVVVCRLFFCCLALFVACCWLSCGVFVVCVRSLFLFLSFGVRLLRLVVNCSCLFCYCSALYVYVYYLCFCCSVFLVVDGCCSLSLFVACC